MIDIDFYNSYTSTSSFLNEDEHLIADWSIDYFEHHILKHLPNNHDIKILDIGCGYGTTLKALINNGYQNVFGIDISEEQITYAKEKLKLECVRLADALSFLKDNLINNKNCFDVILVLDVLEHLELNYSFQLLKLINSSLNNGGLLIIKTPNAIAPFSPHIYWDITHLRGYTTRSLEQCLKYCGISKIKHYSLPPFIHGLKSFLRYLLWFVFLNPIIFLIILIANGDSMGRIYTASFLTIAKK
jgi:2-polyprenyl-3-methyl-5-hydroxy-6-metoxy-1,4-benzoquinol methylase